MTGHIPLGPQPEKIPAGFIDFPTAAKMLGILDFVLRDWRSQRKGPRWFTIGGWRVVYRAMDVAAWINSKAAALDLKAAGLRASAEAARRTVTPEDRPGFMDRTTPASGHVDANASPNPAEAQATRVRAVQRAKRLGDLPLPAVEREPWDTGEGSAP